MPILSVIITRYERLIYAIKKILSLFMGFPETFEILASASGITDKILTALDYHLKAPRLTFVWPSNP